VAFGFSGASDAEEKPGGHGGSQLRRSDGDLWWLAMVKNLGAYDGGQPSACEWGLGGGRCPDRHARAGEGGGYRCTTEGGGEQRVATCLELGCGVGSVCVVSDRVGARLLRHKIFFHRPTPADERKVSFPRPYLKSTKVIFSSVGWSRLTKEMVLLLASHKTDVNYIG
jgi:hypothetical protein